MKKVMNWSYEQGMERIETYKYFGHEITLDENPPKQIHVYRDGKYIGTMDKKGVQGGYTLRQTMQGKRLKTFI